MGSNWWLLVLLGSYLHVGTLGQTADADQIKSLPGLTFDISFNQYSGFFKTSTGNHLHYWLVEAQENPTLKPLVLWLNGGPGCSSLSGLLQENGPFQVSPDGQTLTENVYSWNKLANVLYLESPRDVGFSYRDPSLPHNDTHTDDWTRDDNAEALQQFVQRFNYYSGRPFYITGESYAGVYIPTLALKVTELVDKGTLSLDFKGFAVGNGILSNKDQVNSYMDLAYYRGIIGREDFEFLKSCCPTANISMQYCDYASKYLQFNSSTGFYDPKPFNDSASTKCAKKIANIGQYDMWASEFSVDVYNSIETCYQNNGGYSKDIVEYNRIQRLRTKLSELTTSPVITDGIFRFVDQGSRINKQASDPWNGYYCYSSEAMITYLNKPEVKAALNLDSYATNITWSDCRNLYFNKEGVYIRQYPELDDVFGKLLLWNGNLSILVYGGDTDSVCNFIGVQWFVEALPGLKRITNRTNWHFATYSNTLREVAGSQMRFTSTKTSATIDLLSIKGSGHMVPTDRPGAAYQMISNFLDGTSNYDLATNVSIDPKPLNSNFQGSQQPLLTRKQADRVYEIPGLTYEINFENYAGYLKGVPGNYLHYWLVTSQTSARSDPLFLWLTGGPGCSSLGAFLTELGPFRPNYDNKTLSENIYAWNKFANILFLESPRGVGFSFQDTTVNNDTVWDDDRSTRDAYLALKDFLTVYPEYINREFYVIGESYGGVYVPMLTSYLIDNILSGDIKGLNLIGMAVGNGELNSIIGSNSLMSDMYYHGYIGKGEWDQLAKCCNTTYQKAPLCPFDNRYYVDSEGEAIPIDPTDPCDVLVADKINNVWTDEMLLSSDVYNAYQDCYQQTQYLIGSVRNKKQKRRVARKIHIKNQRNDRAGLMSAYRYANDNYNPVSTDALGGFPCYGTDAASDYMNRPEVRRALHVPEDNPYITNDWEFCNDYINEQYNRQYNDTGRFFDNILASNYPIKILIYNGDTDFACNFMGDQWFVEGIAERWGLTTVEPYSEWHYRQQIAGYAKKFAGGSVTLNLLTVKGAGHMVPMDRPGPAMQMLWNFFNDRSWDTPVAFSTQSTPLKPQYQMKELLANATYAQKSISAYRKALGLQKNGKKTRSKRAVKPDPDPPTTGDREHDMILKLPGLTFELNSNQMQFSGYLSATDGVYLHYWLIESSFNKNDAPLILWLNGGPGCSSLGGLLNELGPFRPSPDGKKLYENVFAWTKAGNVLFLESPRGVGFSYSSGSDYPSDAPYNDNMTATYNVEALLFFFNMFTEYKNRPFYITGESYGGVYIPTFTDALIKRLQKDGITDINFTGIAIGNGELSEVMQINSAVNLLYFRGTYDYQTFKKISNCCPGNTQQIDGYLAPCDFSQYITLDSYGNAHAIPSDNETIAECGRLVEDYGFNNVWGTLNDVYNTYQDCYNPPYADTGLANKKKQKPGKRRSKREAEDIYSNPGQILANAYPFIDQAKLLTKDSTDAFRGVYCYQDDATSTYLNTPEVQQALHVDAAGITWQDCNDYINENYQQQHNDTTSVFESILASGWPLKILIYNGDVDMACEFKGDEWFVEKLASQQGAVPIFARRPWYYKYVDDSGWDYDHRIAGFEKKFNFGKTVILDQLTVKGAGHFVPLDRPGPGLQIIYNFVNNRNYSTPLDYDLVKPALLNVSEQPSPVPIDNTTIRKSTVVRDLPGLTFTPLSMQHSGYVQGATPDSYLHYWFAESQNYPRGDPVVFWFSGDIGCSSVASMLSEIGPFKPNPDGVTLFENVYAWNKYASIVFIDIPREVGFSIQDTDNNPDPHYSDDDTAADATAAIKGWLQTFNNFAGNDIYIGGETYAGVLVPLIAQQIADGISSNDSVFASLNFKGILIGNGHLSKKWDLMHMGDFMYFHGQVSKEYWDALRACCPPTVTYCDISSYINDDGSINTSTDCGKLLNEVSEERLSKGALDIFNVYQDCYGYTNKSFGSSIEAQNAEIEYHVKENAKFRHDNRLATQAAFVSQFTRMNFKSTDSQGGFQCYMVDAIEKYLSQGSVRDALNIPDYVKPFSFCNEKLNILYKPTYNTDYKTDMSDIYTNLMNSPYMQSLNSTTPFKILFYNGDVSLKATTMEAEYFVESLASNLSAKVVIDRTNWLYKQPGAQGSTKTAGYRKEFLFKTQNVKVELATVAGAGTFVAADRPGPALQLFTYFVNSTPNAELSNPVQFSLTPQPLKPQFLPPTEAPPLTPPTDVTMRTTTPLPSTSAGPGSTVPTTLTTQRSNPPPTTTSASEGSASSSPTLTTQGSNPPLNTTPIISTEEPTGTSDQTEPQDYHSTTIASESPERLGFYIPSFLLSIFILQRF